MDPVIEESRGHLGLHFCYPSFDEDTVRIKINKCINMIMNGK